MTAKRPIRSKQFLSHSRNTTYCETIDCSLAFLKRIVYSLRTFQKLCKSSAMHKGVIPLRNESQDNAINGHDATATATASSTSTRYSCLHRTRWPYHEAFIETFMKRSSSAREGLEVDLVHARQNPPSNLFAVLMPILSVLPLTLFLVPHLAVNEQDSKVYNVEVRN